MNNRIKSQQKNWFSDRISSLGEIEAKLTGRYLVKNWLEPGSVSLLYGPSNSGKSLVALDLAMHVAAGHDWHGNKVRGRNGRSGQVLYFCSEGTQGFNNRISAVEIWGPELYTNAKLDDGFLLYPGAVDLSDRRIVDEIVEQLHEQNFTPELIIIDTLARNFGHGEENSTTDMVAFINCVDDLVNAFDAHVMIVHHSGKDRSKNARGSSALNAAVSTEIKVTGGRGKSITIEDTKQRDLSGGEKLTFRIESASLGADEDGEIVTAPYIVFEKDGAANSDATVLKGQPGRALNVLRGLANARNGSAGHSGASKPEWVNKNEWRAACDELPLSSGPSASAPSTAFGRAVENLETANAVKIDGDYVRLA